MAQGGSDLELAGTSYYSRTLDNVDRTSELSVRIDGLQIAPVAPLVPYSDNESDKSDEEEEIEVEKEVEVEETEKEVEFEDEDVEVEVEIETEVEEDVAVEVEIETEVEKEVEKAYSEVEDSEKDIAEEEVEKETNENSEVEENSDVDVEENLEKEIAAEKEGNSEVDENSEVEVEENLEKEIPAENSEVEKEVEDEVDESPDVNVEENSDKETPEEYPSPACNSDSDQISEDEQQSSGEEFVVDKKCPDFTYYKHNINVERRRTRSMAFATPLELMEEDQEEYSEPEFVPKKIMKKRGRKKVVEPVLSDFGDDNGYNNDEYPRFNYTMREPTAEERETGKRLMNGHSEGSNESFMDAENSQSSLPVATPTADTTDNEITSESLPENAEDELKNAYESGTDGDNEESSDDEHFDDSPGPVEENNNTQAVEKVPEVAAPKANSDDVIEVSEDSQETPKKIVDTENAPTVIEHDPLEIPDDSQETTDNNNNEKTAGEDSTAENSVEAAKEIQDTERDQEKIPEANNQRSPPTFEISDDESPKDSQNDMDTADDETVLDEENVFAKETENILAKMAEYHNATDDNKDISNTPDDNSNVPEPSPENNDTLNDNSEDSNSSQESSYSSEDSGSDESERDEENVQVKETEIVHDENSHRTKATDDHKVQDIFDSPDENSNVPEPSPENFENDNAEDSDTVCEWPYFTVVLQNPQMDTANDEPERDEENAEQDQNYGNSPNAAEDTAEDSKQGKDSEKSQRTEENVENDEDSRDLSEVSMDIDDTQTESKMENVPKTAAENPAKNETERDENIRDSPMDIDDDEMENLPMEAEVPKIPQTTSETETNETVPEKTAIIPTPEHYTGISDNDTLEAKDIENTEADLEVEKYTAEAPESEVLESSSDSSHLQTPECLQSGILPHHFKIIKSSPEEDPNLAKFNEMSSDDEDRGGSEIVVVPQPRRHGIFLFFWFYLFW